MIMITWYVILTLIYFFRALDSSTSVLVGEASSIQKLLLYQDNPYFPAPVGHRDGRAALAGPALVGGGGRRDPRVVRPPPPHLRDREAIQ